MIQSKCSKFTSFLTLSLLLFLLCPASSAGAGNIQHNGRKSPTKILILHSYEKNHVCGQPQHDGVISGIEAAGFALGTDFEIQAIFMDTKQKNNTPVLIQKQATHALSVIHQYAPQILVTLDDNAFKSVALKLVDTPISIVFSGLNGQPEMYNEQKPFLESRDRPGHNITGVYEKLHIVDALRVHYNLLGGFEKVKIFTDISPTGRAIARQIELEMAEESPPCAWEMTAIDSWGSYKKEIEAANVDEKVKAIYPAVLLLKDQLARTRTAKEIFQWTVQHSKKTEIPLNYAFSRMGLFGGAAVDFHAMGIQVGTMVARLMNGTTAGDISIEDAQKYALVFNLKRAAQLGIAIPNDILMAADEVIPE